MRYYIYNKIRHRINDYRSEEKLITMALYGFTREGGLDGLLAESVTVKEVYRRRRCLGIYLLESRFDGDHCCCSG